MFVPIQNFGRLGVIHDTINSALPIGAWSNVRNMRFNGIQMEKMLEPRVQHYLDGQPDASDVYDPDSYRTALEDMIASGALWLFDDQPGTGVAADQIGSNDLLETAVLPEYNKPSFLDDDRTCMEAALNSYWQRVEPANTIPFLSGSGTFGLICDQIDTNTDVLAVRAVVGENTELRLWIAKNDLRVEVIGDGDTTEHTYEGVITGGEQNYIVRYDFIDDENMTVEVFLNFASLGLQTLVTTGEYITSGDTALYVGGGARARFQYVWWENALVGEAEIGLLRTALLKNFNDYEATGTVLPAGVRWMQGWSDSFSTYCVIATDTSLLFLRRNSVDDPGVWIDASRTEGYTTGGVWDSFAWGDTCIFNNGIEPPQIFNPTTLRFEDLPGFGRISTADDIATNAEPSRQVGDYCAIIKPYKTYLVAFGVSENGKYQPNTVWWSDTTTEAAYSTRTPGGGPPSWDYESPATASGKSLVGVGSGGAKAAAELNENLVLYTETSATLMSFVGGRFVMGFRRIFGKGAAGQKCAVEFNNQHFVLSTDQIYIHDGSTVKLIAKDRVEEEFFRRIGKGGRFGGGEVDWELIQVVKNPDRKEIYILFGGIFEECRGPLCDAYEKALIDSSAVGIWLMNDGGPTFGGQIIPSVRDIGAHSMSEEAEVTSSTEPGLLEFTCDPELSYEYGNNGSTSVAAGNYLGSDTEMAFTWTALINFDDIPEEEFFRAIYLDTSFDYELGMENDAGTLSIYIDAAAVGGGYIAEVNDIFSNNPGNHVLSLAVRDNLLTVFVDWVEVFTEATGLFTPVSGNRDFRNWSMQGSLNLSHVATWNQYVEPADVARLREGWLRNQLNYVDPNCGGPT